MYVVVFLPLQCICILLKTLLHNSFYSFWKQILLILLINQHNQNPLWTFHFHKSLYRFCYHNFLFTFWIFFIIHWFTNEFFFNTNADFTPYFFVFFQQLIISNHKRDIYIYIFSFLKTLSIYFFNMKVFYKATFLFHDRLLHPISVFIYPLFTYICIDFFHILFHLFVYLLDDNNIVLFYSFSFFMSLNDPLSCLN